MTVLRRLMMAGFGSGAFDVSCCYGPLPDSPPAVPNVNDEEFTGALSGSWHVIDSGTTQTYDAGSTITSCLYIESNSPGAHTNGVYKAWTPTAGAKVTAKIAGYANPLGAGVRTDVGLFLGEATPGKFIHGCLDVAEDDYMTICGSYWTSPTVWSNNIGDFLNAGSGAGSAWRSQGFGYLRPHWVRFVYNSSSSIDGYVSWDGLLFTKWLSAYNPGFTIGSVGIDMHVGTALNEVAVDYLRFS